MVEWLTSIIILLGCWFLPWNQSQISDRIFNRSIIGACDLIVDAGPDTSVCYPGGVLTLMGSVTGNALYTQWMPSSGLSNPFILNPVAAITGPITYTLTAYGIDPDSPNLVVNGDFELGNTGFTSDY